MNRGPRYLCVLGRRLWSSTLYTLAIWYCVGAVMDYKRTIPITFSVLLGYFPLKKNIIFPDIFNSLSRTLIYL